MSHGAVNPGKSMKDGSVTVLCVDDTPDVLDSLVALLELWGFYVLVARDGAEAIHVAMQHRPGIILSDLGMPGLDGFDFARSIRRQQWGSDVLLIAQSGWTSQETKTYAYAAGYDHFLPKPIEFEKLKGLLAEPGFRSADDSHR